MDRGALTLALTAGMLAAVNPCGFALLPAYLGLLVADRARPDPIARVGRALLLTAAMTVGFIAVFLVFGLVIAPSASSIQQYLPWFTCVLGVLLLVAGAWMLSGRSLPSPRWRSRGPEITGSLPVMVAFGASYATASITCTIAPFLVLVVTSLRTGSTLEGLALFATYGVGMGLVVATAAVAVALANTSVIGRMRRFGRWVPRLAGVLLVVSGAYVAYYGWWELRVLDGAASGDPVIDTAQRLRGHLADSVMSLGATTIAITLAVLVVLAVALGTFRNRSDSTD